MTKNVLLILGLLAITACTTQDFTQQAKESGINVATDVMTNGTEVKDAAIKESKVVVDKILK